jgi:hypothetical protein
MKKYVVIFFTMVCFCVMGCGYTTRSASMGGLRTIHIDDFENEIAYTDEGGKNLYIPLLELDVTNAVIDRFLFDGNLKVVNEDKADLILKGKLLNYQRDVLRYTEDEDAWEYRISITVSLEMWNTQTQEMEWRESAFVGDTEYFVSGSLAKSEEVAIDEAVVDLARRIVERTIEDW